MTNRKNTRRALVLSLLSLLLCCSMLVGTTFAWFTDSVTSNRNTIVAGNLDVVLEYWDGSKYTEVDGDTKLFNDAALWEPGYTEVAYLKVSNAGSLALKYQLAVNVYEEILGKTKTGADIKLSDHLQFKVVESDTDLVGTYASREAAQAAKATATKLQTYNSDVKPLEAKNEAGDNNYFDYVALIIYMPTTVGNEANHDGKNVPSIQMGVELFATQQVKESDSFDNTYDEYAGLPWDGESVTENLTPDANNVYRISSAADLIAMMADSKYPNNNKYQNVVLECDINLGGHTISGFGDGSGFFDGIFDGQGHTISNFTIDASNRTYYAGLFNQVAQYSGENTVIKNLTVKGATVIGHGQVGVIAGGMNGNTVVDNCKVIDCTAMGVKKVGAVVGYTAGGTVTNNYAENCVVYYSEKEAAEILGYENTGSTVNNNSFKDVAVKCRVSTADELAAAVKKGITDIVLADGVYDVYGCESNNTLTISGSEKAVIKLYNEGENGCDYAFRGDVIFNGVTIDTTDNTGSYKGFAYMKGTFNDCNFVGAYSLNNANDFAFNNCTFDFKDGYFWTWAGKSVTFDGCTFNGNSKAILAHGYASTEITIKNCTFAATEKGYAGGGLYWTAAVEIDPAGSNTYVIDITNSTITDSYVALTRSKDNSTGHKITIDGVNAVPAKTVTYDGTASMQDVLDGMKPGDTLALPARTIETSGTFVIPAGVTVMGDAKGGTIICQINAGQDNIFNCEGDVIIKNISFETNRKGYAITDNTKNHDTDGDITVVNCTFKGLATEKNWGVYKNLNGNLTIEGCTFDNYHNAVCGVSNGNGSATTITGCTFTNINGEAIGYVASTMPADFEANVIANNTGLTAENVIGY